MPESLSYDLHKLGWRAFQDLSAVVLQTTLGQTFHAFADSNDGGRDGAFYGNWLATRLDEPATIPQDFTEAGAVVAQCKFSALGVGTLTPTSLRDELAKVEQLHTRGLCDAYILMTNLRVTGQTEAWLRTELQQRGVAHTMALDGNWICQQISIRPALRRYVPRVYGLGDLGQILDERRLEQAKVLLANLSEDLATFVPTAAYRQAADALANHGFTLLLGAPAAGKSTIAAMLSTVALDEWGCGVRRVDSAAELLASWNPNEPDQLFWVDDAFGAIRHDQQLTDQWARRLDQIMALVKSGGRIILTSRDYIYRQARVHLKEYAYPKLSEQTVVVNVEELPSEQRRQILYNHLREGNQPAEVLQQWRPHLPAVADSNTFQPEIARRLGHRAFTARVEHGHQLLDYVKRPVDFLADVLAQLSPAAKGALACVYLSGDGLPTPVQFSDRLTEAVTQLGATIPEVFQAFGHLDETFLAPVADIHGGRSWRFRHPTIREGFASMIAADPNSTHIVVDGLTDEELVRQVDCGGGATGTLVSVPAQLYPSVAARVSLDTALNGHNWYNQTAQFLTDRCSDEFLRIWMPTNTEHLPGLLDFEYLFGVSWRPKLLARLHVAGALSTDVRDQAITILVDKALEQFDATWLDPGVIVLFTPPERRELLARVTAEVLPEIDDLIDQSADGYDSDVNPAERYSSARETVATYLDAFVDVPTASAVLEEALETINVRVAEAEDDFRRPSASSSLAAPANSPTTTSNRDQFDDVHIGH